MTWTRFDLESPDTWPPIRELVLWSCGHRVSMGSIDEEGDLWDADSDFDDGFEPARYTYHWLAIPEAPS